MIPANFKKRRRILLLAGCAFAALLVILLWPSAEPSCNGKSLSQWLDVYHRRRQGPWPDTNQVTLASNAIHSIGTNAIPLLITWLKYERPAWRKATISLMDMLPVELGDRGITYWLRSDEWTRRERAVNGFYILGPVATPALPGLADQLMAGDSPSRPSAVTAAQCLTFIGKGAFPHLLVGLTNDQPSVRTAASGALAVLAHDGIDITPAIPTLIECLRDTNAAIAHRAAWALGSLKTSPEVIVPHLTEALRDSRPVIRRSAANALGQFETNAASAAPILLQTLTDPERSVRVAVTNALLGISPESLPSVFPKN